MTNDIKKTNWRTILNYKILERDYMFMEVWLS